MVITELILQRANRYTYAGNLARVKVRRAAERDSVGAALLPPWLQAR